MPARTAARPEDVDLMQILQQVAREKSIEMDRWVSALEDAMASAAKKQHRIKEPVRSHFNPETTGDLMCRSQLSVGWDGRLFDCDFNQMLELPLGSGDRTIFDVSTLDALETDHIATGRHCFGCTAGAGSSCQGSIA